VSLSVSNPQPAAALSGQGSITKWSRASFAQSWITTDYGPCETVPTVPVSDWAACQNFYTNDRARSELFLGIWLVVLSAFAALSLSVLRRR